MALAGERPHLVFVFVSQTDPEFISLRFMLCHSAGHLANERGRERDNGLKAQTLTVSVYCRPDI